MAVRDSLQAVPARAAHDLLHRRGALAKVHGDGHDVVRIAGEHLLLGHGAPAVHIRKRVGQAAQGRQLVHEGVAAGRPQAVLERGHLEVHRPAGRLALRGDCIKRGLHIRNQRLGLRVPARQRADHADRRIHALDIVGVADDHLHAVLLKHADLFHRLGHVAHEHHLRLEREDFLDVGLRAGLNDRHCGNRLRVVAVRAAADEQAFAAQRAEDFAVGRRQRDDALRRLAERDLAAIHIGDGNGRALGAGAAQAEREQHGEKQSKNLSGHDSPSCFLIK